jgi:hypothetical protein
MAGLPVGLASKSSPAATFPRKAGSADPAFGTAPVAFVALGQQQLGKEPAVGQLLALCGVGGFGEPAAQGGQAQGAAGGVDGGVGGLFGQAAAAVGEAGGS